MEHAHRWSVNVQDPKIGMTTYQVDSFAGTISARDAFSAASKQHRGVYDLPSSASLLMAGASPVPIKIGESFDLGPCANGADCVGLETFVVKAEQWRDYRGDVTLVLDLPERRTPVPATPRPDGICGRCFHAAKRAHEAETA